MCNLRLSLLAVALLAVAAHAAIAKGSAGWNDDPSTNYHIQTDEGPERYFRYQTTSGQYRKEKRLEDGTVVGTYGWVDPTGLLLLRDYVADNSGYRIVRTKKIFVGLDSDNAGKTSTVSAAPKQDYVVPSAPLKVYQAPALPTAPVQVYQPTNLYDNPSTGPIQPQAANFNSHPYYESDEYTPVIGFQKKQPTNQPAIGYGQKLNYQPANTYQTYQPSYQPAYQSQAYQQPAYQSQTVYQPAQSAYQKQSYQSQQNALNSQYDGVSTTQNGFKYYLPRQYHEEQTNSADDRAGSFGYIDPFGIRRVIYYNTSPGSGFQVKKNNRYVGFDSTPYDPRV